EDGVYTSLTDMKAWIYAIENNTLIGPEMTERVFSPVQDSRGEEVSYGYGWSFGEMYKHKLIVHTGGWVGFNTIVANIPDRKLWLVAFSNTDAIDSENAVLEMAKYYLKVDSDTI
ncbi:MAG: serine hydrolase, partial [Pseudomonadota bacterium]